MTDRIDRATIQQNRAANPGHSTFVSANAGSGKTTVLTARIARLLFQGVRPENILCVTFTKAAAGEVQNRVFRQLGEWVLLDDEALRAALMKLGEEDLSVLKLRQARRLFARAIETPGGLKIHTIHAFAASLLRRFPLEAGVSPSFRELDDYQASQHQLRIMRAVAIAHPQAYQKVADLYAVDDSFLRTVFGLGDGFRADFDRNQAMADFGFTAPKSPEEFLRDNAFLLGDDEWLDWAGRTADTAGKRAFARFARARMAGDARGAVQALYSVLHTDKGELRKAFTKNDNQSKIQTLVDDFPALAQGLFLDQLGQLHYFLGRVVDAYDNFKREAGYLDFDDLIANTERLLTQNNRINWVMYRLDSDIEHILVDEAQDTNARQWNIIDALARNWAEGENRGQTLFVVGDDKQSIFRFQGADPTIFKAKAIDYRQLVEAMGNRFATTEMQLSFRSSSVVLDFVDVLFAQDGANGLGGAPKHLARADDIAGAIEIWKPLVAEDKPEERPWYSPQIEAAQNVELSLARAVAKRISDDIAAAVPIALQDGDVRPRRAGDYLILLRSRSNFFYAVQKELRERGVAIAGYDRVKLNSELAIQDLMALLRVAVAPFDELSLAAFLRSPLGGLDEAALYRLATNRGTASLEGRLRADPRFTAAVDLLDFARESADFMRPHDLIYAVLVRFGGEKKLRARLGVAVEDALARFLDVALQYEAEGTPSLVGFIAWFDNQEIEVKRLLDDNTGAVRVMTVHGAKGLEAPIVIYPFIERQSPNPKAFVRLDGCAIPSRGRVDGLPVPEAIAIAQQRHKDEEELERDRLLYVALTRAQTELMICGALKAPTSKTPADDDGVPLHPDYQIMQNALRELAGAELGHNDDGAMRYARNWPSAVNSDPPQDDHVALGTAINPLVADEQSLPKNVAVTSLFQADADKSSHGRGAEFGSAVHLLLELLATLAEDQWPIVATTHIADEVLRDAALEEVRKAFAAHPELRDGSWLREVDLHWLAPNGRGINGRIDALRYDAETNTMRIVDFKTDLDIAHNIDGLGANYLGQLAIYIAAIKSVYPDRHVVGEILWTADQSRLIVSGNDLTDVMDLLCE